MHLSDLRWKPPLCQRNYVLTQTAVFRIKGCMTAKVTDHKSHAQARHRRNSDVELCRASGGSC